MKNLIPQDKLTQARQWIDAAHNVVIVSHVSPDGDAIGASLGLMHVLKACGKNVKVVMPNYFPDFLRWLPGATDILMYSRMKSACERCVAEADAIACLDFNELKRIEPMDKLLMTSKARRLHIDHHLNPNLDADVTLSYPTASATAEIVFRLVWQLELMEHMHREAATCIYCGIMTDTGALAYNSNKADLFNIVAELIKKGIDKDAIYRNVFYTYSETRMKLMGYMLYEKLEVMPEYKAALMWLDKDEMNRFCVVKGDTEGFVNLPLQMRDVLFSTYIHDDTEKDGYVRLSFRSIGSFPCNKFAAEFFNGGGHLNAAGGEFHGSIADAIMRYKLSLMKFKWEKSGDRNP